MRLTIDKLIRNHLLRPVTSDNLTLSFVVSALIFLMAQTVTDAHDFRGDARLYWSLSSTIWDLSFPQTVRGYVYPLLLSPARALFDRNIDAGPTLLKLCHSIIYGYFFAVTLPNLYTKIIGGTTSVAKRVTLALIVSIIFPGLVSYPLSDAPSFALTVYSMSCVLLAYDKKTVTKKMAYLMMAGLLSYAAYNTRTIYIFSFAAMAVAVVAITIGNTWVKTICLLAFLSGSLIGAAPQMVINKKYNDNFSPLITTGLQGDSLYVSQLMWGLIVDRYETYIEKGKAGGTPVFYANSRGIEILKEKGVDLTSPRLSDYVDIALKHPADLLTIYLRHTASALDARDGDVYTTTPSYNKSIRSFMYLMIVTLGLTQLARSLISNKTISHNRYKVMWLATLTLPCFASIPGAVETRFFFPIFCLAYCSLSLESVAHGKLNTNKWQALIAALLLTSIFIFVQKSVSNPIHERPESYIQTVE
ncbi:hypothetical protein [Pseudomonas petrae]|uniref:hypothetical protein n=1 Tax=Pseudomonas petrae TaxID=2912190 RepID=UPI001F246B09|nr:hypothetical protein [Pseudomonas petrae]MCF7557871.1 hypothetical protein [Pseudomonas petrae]